jgi:hypothetical protein
MITEEHLIIALKNFQTGVPRAACPNLIEEVGVLTGKTLEQRD